MKLPISKKLRVLLFLPVLIGIVLGLRLRQTTSAVNSFNGNVHTVAALNALPPTMLWAWERPEQLDFIDTQNTGVAFLAKTVLLSNGEVTSRPRLQPLILAKGTKVVAALNEFLATEQPAAKKFLAIYTWLKNPGLEPVVDQGIGRETELHTRDLLRDNWWCSAAISSAPEITAAEDDAPLSYTAEGDKAPAFLSSAETAAAEREFAALKALGAGPNYISGQVIDWANRNPKDPRVPEALHLAVHTTRYGCTDQATPRWSKAAYDVLHRKYPNSTWARKTKYWFKD